MINRIQGDEDEMDRRTALLLVVLAAIVIVGGSYAYFSYSSGTLVVEMTDPPEHWGPASNVYNATAR